MESIQNKFRLDRVTESSEDLQAPFYLKITCKACSTSFMTDLRRENLKNRLEEHVETCPAKSGKVKSISIS
jgi:hypothetical protein